MNERERFRDRLAQRPLLADGGDGHAPVLAGRPAAGLPRRARRRRRPDLIGAIHREYLEAGADLIETATFGANRSRLAAFGLADRAAPAQPARRPARPRGARRRGSRRRSSPARSARSAPRRAISSSLDDAAVRAAFREQIDGLLEGGVDLFMLETFSTSATCCSPSTRRAARGGPADRRRR